MPWSFSYKSQEKAGIFIHQLPFLKGIQEIFIGRTDAEAPLLWPLNVKSRLIGKDSDAGKNWGQEEKGTIEDEMVDGITNSMDMSLSKLQEIVKDREARHAPAHEVTKSWTQLSD